MMVFGFVWVKGATPMLRKLQKFRMGSLNVPQAVLLDEEGLLNRIKRSKG